MNYSKTVIVGRLGKDPELKALPNGQYVCSFSIATSYIYKDRDGKSQEDTEWHNVVFWGKSAETIAKYCQKGSMLLVEGRNQTRSWDKDGQKMYRTEIVGERFQFGPKTNKNDEAEEFQQQATPRNSSSQSSGPDLPDYPEEEINPEDIPF